MKKLLSIIAIYLITNTLLAQDKFDIIHKLDVLGMDTTLTPLSKEDDSTSVIFIKDYHYKEWLNTKLFKTLVLPNDVLFRFTTIHRRIRLNNNEAVERYNTMYIPVSDNSELIGLKARTINPDGTVKYFDENNVLYIENYENHGPMKIFAFEGVQVGAEIEFVYILQEFSENYYGHLYIQENFPKKSFALEFIFPSYLKFETKSYNNAPNLIEDSVADNRTRLSITPINIKAHEKEEYAAERATMMRLEYVLRENSYNKGNRFYTWTSAGEEYAEFFFELATDKKKNKNEVKALKNILKQSKINNKITDKEAVIILESFLKSQIAVSEDHSQVLADEIWKTKTASEHGITRLYVLLLQQLGIYCELVLTHNRYEKYFDNSFETHNIFSDYLIYFPQFKLYTHPSSYHLRLGEAPYNLSYTNGLFVNKTAVANPKYISTVKYIEGLPMELSYDNMFIDLKLDADFNKANISLKKVSLGFSASNLRPYLNFMNDEKKKELLENYFNIIGKDGEVTELKTENTKMFGYMLDYPFIMEGKITNSDIIQQAGDKTLIKVGELIGPQVEMYQDKNREFDVENYYNHSYLREIKFEIPNGYEIVNLNELNMDFFGLNKQNKRIMEFKSSYKVDGNVLIITVTEFYNEIRLPKERYEEFRKVINAAADFNKKVLILSPKK
jgi:hypothetical protein